MANNFSQRHRTATFGPIAVSLATHGTYRTELPGDNFGQRWRASRLYFPLEGELRFTAIGQNGVNGNDGPKSAVCGARSAVLLAGWQPAQMESEGAKVLEVDIAAERFEERDLLLGLKFATWAPESCLPGATAAALRELMEHTGSTSAIRVETSRVVEGLIGSMLQVAHLAGEAQAATSLAATSLAAASLAGGAGTGVAGLGLPDGEPKFDYQIAMKYISRKFTDPALTPATIAQHFGVSLRTLYRYFDGGGDGVSHAIASARLEAATHKLTDPKFGDYTLDELAERCGYHSPLAMRRAIMASSGLTPSQLRAKSL